MKTIFVFFAIFIASQADASAIPKEVNKALIFDNKDPLSDKRFCTCNGDGCECIIKEHANTTDGSLVPFEEAAERSKRSCCKLNENVKFVLF